MDVNYDLPDFYLTRLQERLHTWEAFESQIIDKIPGFKEKLGKYYVNIHVVYTILH